MVRKQTWIVALVTIAAGLISILILSEATHTIIVGDPAEFRRRIEAMAGGGIPYLEVPFEHLPVMLVPMLLAWALGGAASQTAFVYLFALLMTATMSAAGMLVDSAGRVFEDNAVGRRWLLLVVPLMPLAVFRNDPLAVLLFAAGLLALLKERSSWAWLSAAGALAKVWPGALSVMAWKRGRRLGAFLTAVLSLVAVGWTFVPGFATARAAAGIHAETVVGSLLGAFRILSGRPSDVVISTAAYFDVDIWWIILNAAVGVTVSAVAVRALLLATTRRAEVLAIGALVIGVILVSPLSSLQYVLWLAPALAFSQRRRTLVAGVALGALATALAWTWAPEMFECAWFYAGLVGRNILLIVIAALLVREAGIRSAPA